MKTLRQLAACALVILPLVVAADERQDLLELRSTILNLVDALIEQGVLTREQAEAIERQAARSAREQAQQQLIAEADEVVEAEPEDGERATRVVRVPYVPEFVKDEIRAEVRAELRGEVTEDVVARARSERWGIPEALPAWIRGLQWSGDARLREQSEFFAADNLPNSFPNFARINDAGSLSGAGANAFLNTTEDRDRLRMRLRLALRAQPTDELTVGARLVTGNLDSPVSANKTLGQDGLGNFEVVMDRAYIRWDNRDARGRDWLTLVGGRMPNPFLYTDLVWDGDLNFDGVAATVRHRFGGAGELAAAGQPRSAVMITAGAFPIDEAELAFPDGSSNDKWLWGGQFAFTHRFDDRSAFEIGLAYYDYVNITGRRNDFASVARDWTAPGFMQKGNTLFDIRNDADPDSVLFALAADYSLIDVVASYRYAGFDPIHVVLSADYVENVGYDEDSIERRTGVRVPERNSGYQLMLEAGWPEIAKWGDWAVFGGYRYLQRDAVLDAFTESNFHLGGTNAKGWILGARYGLARNTWLRARWLSADEIDGTPLGIDVLQLDVNTRF